MTAASNRVSASDNRTGRWIIPLGLALLLVIFVVLAARTSRTPDTRPYEFDSAGYYGLRALRESLREMGYRVKDLRDDAFVLPTDGDLLLVWPGDQSWTEEEVLALRRWVAEGRTAAVVASTYDMQRAFVPWGADAYSGYSIGLFDDVVQSQPAFPAAPANIEGASGSTAYAFSQRIVQMTVDGSSVWRATLGVEQIGEGWLWHNTDVHALTNNILRTPDQTAVLAAILRDIPDGGTIYFDGFHLYGPRRAEEDTPVRTLQEWLYRTPLGQALLLALLIGVVGWIMAGRRLGPPLKTERELKRREGAEYVRAIAGLKRRAHAHDEVARRLALRIKVVLGKPRRIPATLDDAPFIAALRATGDMDAALLEQVAALLKRIRAAKTEQELVNAAAALETLLA